MTKYVYANIRVPIKVSDDFSVFDILSEHMMIDFEACPDLEFSAAETSAAAAVAAETNLINKLMNMSDLGITKSIFENEKPQKDKLADFIEHEKDDTKEMEDGLLPENELTMKINKGGFLQNSRKRDNLTFRVMPKKTTTTQTRKVYRVIH